MVSAHTTGDGGNFSSPLTTETRSALVRSSATPATYWSSESSPRSHCGTTGLPPASSGRSHFCQRSFPFPFGEPITSSLSVSLEQTTAVRHCGTAAHQ